MEKYIITVLGKDRPGIIAALSKSLFELDCNLENVNQMSWQNEFAGFFVIQASETLNCQALQDELEKRLQGESLHIHIKKLETTSNSITYDPEQGELFIISTIGPDQKGLVAGISQIIAGQNANIINLQAVFKGGEEPGDNVMCYEVFIDPGVDRKALFSALKEKALELNLDIRIQHKNIFNTVNRI